MLGCLPGGVAEQRADGGQTGIAVHAVAVFGVVLTCCPLHLLARLDRPAPAAERGLPLGAGPALAASLLLAGTRLTHAEAAGLLGDVTTHWTVTGTLQRLHATPQWRDICTALTTLADHLDAQPPAIDYERRRHLDYTSLLPDAEWEDIRLRTERADHLQLSRRLAPYARHVLFTRLSGLPFTWAPFARSRDGHTFKTRLAAFITAMTPELAAELTRLAEEFLARHQIREEPAAWQPSAKVLDGLDLPGPDLASLDLNEVHKLARTDGASAAAIARRFGTTSDAIQAILLDHQAPADPPAAPAAAGHAMPSPASSSGTSTTTRDSHSPKSGSSPATAQPLSGTSPAPTPSRWTHSPSLRDHRPPTLVWRGGGMRASTPALAAGRRHSVSCRRDGTVLAVGNNAAGECRVGQWEDVTAVAAGNVHTANNTGKSHTVGLRSDGTVLATGWNGDGQCDVAAWRDVTAVAAGWRRTLGLLANGTVLAAGRGSEGQCDTRSWREMVALSCGDWHSAGVRADGRALAAGNNRRGQCAVDGWRGLTAVAAGYLHTVALRGNGRVLAAGDGTTGACDVDAWEDAVALAAGSYHTVAVTASGRVLAAGDNSHGQCDVGGWRDIVAVAAGSTHTLGLRSDGTIVSAGSNASGQCDVGSWSGIRVPGARA